MINIIIFGDVLLPRPILKKILAKPSAHIALIALFILAGMLSSLNPWEHLENKNYDFWASHFRSPENQPVTIVAIDGKSIRELGDWPWPRSRIAEMVRLLSAGRAAAIGICPLYTLPDPNPGLQEIRDMKTQVADQKWKGGRQAARIVANMLDEAEERLDNDYHLITAVRRARNAVLPIFFTSEGQPGAESDNVTGMLIINSLNAEALTSGAAGTPSEDAGTPKEAPRPPATFTMVRETFGDLASKAGALGHLNLAEDRDGVFRRMPLLIEYNDRLFPSLCLQLAIKHMGGNIKDLTIGRDFFGQPCLRIKYLEVATDQAYRMLMNYDRQWTRERTYSFVDALQGRLEPAVFKNKIVLIGVTGEGLAPSYRVGPHDRVSSVEITANGLARILSATRLSRPLWAQPLETMALLYFAFFLMFVVPRVNINVGALIIGIFLATWYLLAVVLLLAHGYRIKLFGPVVLACCGFLYVQVAGYIRERQREVLDANKTLGLHYQGQGMLDMACERFMKCPARNESVKDLLYNLGLDLERKRMFHKALIVYQHIGRHGAFRDIEERSGRLNMLVTPMPVAPIGGSLEATVLMVNADIKPTFGRYEILNELGRGSMGTVFLGRDPKINREVAIKTLKYAEVDAADVAQVKARFFREAEAAGKLSHPNIVSIYDVGEEHDMAYIAMELLNGTNLTRLCKPEGLLQAATAMAVIADVASALDYAHSQGVIHRDIKPANIMLLEDGRVKVTDFGIALVVDESRTRTGLVMGTPNYMSPEQVAGADLDGRSDLFSLGIVFYEMLTGTKPFKGENIAAITYAITHTPHTPLSESKQDIPLSCQAIVDKLLAKELTERFESAAELSKAIETCLAELQHSAPAAVI